MSLDLSNSVGAEGANHREDVVRIQQALNRIPINHGGPTFQLAADGNNSPQFRSAIGRFQLHNFGWTDFRVNRNGVTIRLLGSIINSQKPPNATPKPILTAQELQQLTQRNNSSSQHQPSVIVNPNRARISNIRGECYVNGERVTQEGFRDLPAGSRIGTLGDSSFTVSFSDGTRMVVEGNSLIVILDRSSQRVDAGPRMPVTLEGGHNSRFSLGSLAGL